MVILGQSWGNYDFLNQRNWKYIKLNLVGTLFLCYFVLLMLLTWWRSSMSSRSLSLSFWLPLNIWKDILFWVVSDMSFDTNLYTNTCNCLCSQFAISSKEKSPSPQKKKIASPYKKAHSCNFLCPVVLLLAKLNFFLGFQKEYDRIWSTSCGSNLLVPGFESRRKHSAGQASCILH